MAILNDVTRLELPWETLESLLKGMSSLDLSAMPLRNEAEAHQFVRHYGYDPENAEDAEELRSLFEEAVHFIENHFLSAATDWAALGEPLPPQANIPGEIIQCGSVVDLLLTASNGTGLDRHWACAILKVMHTLVHIQNGLGYQTFEAAKEQILSRFESILQPVGDGIRLVAPAGGVEIPVVDFQIKNNKTRESILIKLLCKKESVAEEVRDLIGVRLITRTRAEALLAVNLLREHKVIVFPNIIPSRSRNTLIDLAEFRQHYDAVVAKNLPVAETLALLKEMEAAPTEANFQDHNPASSDQYRSIHITCRQLIRLTPPGAVKESRFFFPYEIQVMDEESYLESQQGSSAHRTYKRKQLLTARRRVLGLLLKAGDNH